MLSHSPFCPAWSQPTGTFKKLNIFLSPLFGEGSRDVPQTALLMVNEIFVLRKQFCFCHVPSSPSPPSRAHPASRHASPFSWMWGLEESKPHLSQMQWRPLWQILPCFTSHEHVLMSPSKNPPQLLLCWSKLSFGLVSVNEASAQGEFGTTAPYLHDMQMAVDMTFPPVANITGNVNWQPRAQRCFSPHPINASETFCKAEILAHGPTLKSVSEL